MATAGFLAPPVCGGEVARKAPTAPEVAILACVEKSFGVPRLLSSWQPSAQISEFSCVERCTAASGLRDRDRAGSQRVGCVSSAQ